VAADDGLIEAKSITGNLDMTLYEIVAILIKSKEIAIASSGNTSSHTFQQAIKALFVKPTLAQETQSG
jgi:hypothetical protein